MAREYELIDAGNGRKLERFGPYMIDRPCAQAVWRPRLPEARWREADAVFTREDGNQWVYRRELPESWVVDVEGLRFEVGPTDFGHLGVFPEHARAWQTIAETGQGSTGGGEPPSLLNLFAYSGGATLAAARAGFSVCHLDASRKMVGQGGRNAELNGLREAPIRWIVDDVHKFLKREIRRGNRYDAIVLDPPSFGRGKRQELFKIDDHMTGLLDLCRQVLSERPRLVFLSCHTPGYTPLVLEHLLGQALGRVRDGDIHSGEMVLTGEAGVLPVPCGTYAFWGVGAGG